MLPKAKCQKCDAVYRGWALESDILDCDCGGKLKIVDNDERLKIVGYKDGKKACEIDITDMSHEEAATIIASQEIQGRTWEYQRA